MTHFLLRLLPGCGKPSHAADDNAATLAGRPGQSVRASAGPEALSRRSRGSEMAAPARRPQGVGTSSCRQQPLGERTLSAGERPQSGPQATPTLSSSPLCLPTFTPESDAQMVRGIKFTQVAPCEQEPSAPELGAALPGRVAGGAAPTQERTGLRSRRQVIVDTVAQTAHGTADAAWQVARKACPPKARKAVANASITHAIGATLNTLMEPGRLAALAASTLAQAGSSWWNKPRLSSQALQQALLGEGVDLGNKHDQVLAHAHAVNYGAAAATMLDTALPGLHKVLGVGVAGTTMAFGAGRNAGLAAGDALGRLERGDPQAAGVTAGPELPAKTLSSATAFKLAGTGVQQWLLGSAAGAVGNMAGQYLVAPLVNFIPRQFQAIDPRAVLPDETVELMNRLEPHSGDALRAQVRHAQHDVADIDSAGNVLTGQIAFDTFTAARFATHGGLPLGAAGQVAVGLGVSTAAGMAVGAVLAMRQSTATVTIPDIEALRQAEATHAAQPGSDGAAILAKVPKNPVPLFFPRKMTPTASPPQAHDIETGCGESITTADAAQRGRLAGMVDTAKWAVAQAIRPVAAVGQAWGQSLGTSPLIEPAEPGTDGAFTVGRAAATASNVGASLWIRGTEMARATMNTSLWSTASAMAASTTEGPARNVVLALGNGIGIHAAVKPWFDALAGTIPQGDKAIRERRLGLAKPQGGV